MTPKTRKRTQDRGRALRLGRAHKDYIIGQHWLSVAYERICAGEDEHDVLADYGYFDPTDTFYVARKK
jgi:hypothetical protein